MKKILLSVLALLAIIGSGTAQNLPSYVPANGLVGWWPFNGNANDESGNNNNGTVNGATLSTDRFGNAGNAYQFDGVDDFIEIIHHPSLNLPNGTINLWFKTSSNNRMCLFNKANFNDASNENYNATLNYFSPGVSGIGYFSKYNSNCLPGSGWVGAANSLNFSNGTYHMISCITSSTSIQIFVDAILQSNIAAPNAQADTCSNSNLRIGQNWANYLEPYIGDIDDIAIYNRALSQQEITALYQGGNTTASCLDMPSNLQQGLVGYWPFCGNALDESGNNNHGTVNGATLTTDRFGNQGSAYDFNGVNNWIDVSNNSSINFQNSFSISVWVNSNQNNVNAGIIGKWNDFDGLVLGGQEQYALTVNGNLLYALLRTTISPSQNIEISYSGSNYNNGSWNLFVFSWDGNTIKLYQNGFLVGSGLANGVMNSFNQNLEFGRYGGGQATSGGNTHFAGSLDDIAIWNRALSQSEITQLYNQGICQTSITVTDTLLIHTGITSYNPVAYQNTVKVWPNPGNQDITLDAGNLSSMQGWKYKVANGLGQIVKPETAINQQQTLIDLTTWGGSGIYYLHLINPQGIAVEIKKIVLAP